MELIIYFQEMWRLAVEGEAQGIFFMFCLYVFIACVYSLVFQLRMRQWPFVLGELVEFGVKRFGASTIKSDQNYKAGALYRYTVSGVSYDGTRLSPWLMLVTYNLRFLIEKQMSYVKRNPDGKVKVYYNPNNPKKSFLVIAGKIGIFVTLLISILPFFLFYYKYYV